jgi:hypothetical protein
MTRLKFIFTMASRAAVVQRARSRAAPSSRMVSPFR